MSNKYTASEEKIYFLTGRNIVSALTDTIENDPVPSLELLNEVNNDLSDGVKANFVYLSGGNTSADNHAISGDNDYVGEHRFANISATSATMTNLSVTTKLSATAIDVVDLSVTSIKTPNLTASTTINAEEIIVDELSANTSELIEANIEIATITDLTATNSNITTLTAENVSADNLSVEKNLSVNFNAVFNTDNAPGAKYKTLSAVTEAIDKKIYIDPIGSDSMCSDISIIELDYAGYAAKVVDAKTNGVSLSSNVLYVIKDNYVDMFNMELCNVASGGVSSAVPRKYIDDLCTALSTSSNEYADSLSTSLSTTVNKTAAKFNTLSIHNDAVNQKLCVLIQDLSGNIHYSSIDTDDFIKDGMLSTVSLVTDTTSDKEYIVFKFNTDGGPNELSLDVHKLVDVYTAGTGLTLTEETTGKKFNVDWTKVASKLI